MSNGWDLSIGGGSKASSKKAEFTAFPVGITRIRVIDDAPFMRWTHWWAAASRSINCPGRGCPICEIRRAAKANKQPATHGMSRRYAINIINRETNRAEIMEQGVGFFEDLRDLREELTKQDTDLQGADIKVKRRGSGQDDTSYRLDIDVVAPLSEADEKLAQDKTNLEEYFKPHPPEQILELLNGKPWLEVFSAKPAETAQAEPESPSSDEEFTVK